MAVVCVLLGGSIGSWVIGAQGGDLQAGLLAILVGVGGILASNVLHAANLFVEAVRDQIVVTHLRPEDAETEKDSRSVALRDLLAFGEVSIYFVLVVLALLVGCMGLSQGFNACRAFVMITAVLLTVASSWGVSAVKRRVEVAPVER